MVKGTASSPQKPRSQTRREHCGCCWGPNLVSSECKWSHQAPCAALNCEYLCILYSLILPKQNMCKEKLWKMRRKCSKTPRRCKRRQESGKRSRHVLTCQDMSRHVTGEIWWNLVKHAGHGTELHADAEWLLQISAKPWSVMASDASALCEVRHPTMSFDHVFTYVSHLFHI